MFSETMVGIHGAEPPAVAAAYDFSSLQDDRRRRRSHGESPDHDSRVNIPALAAFSTIFPTSCAMRLR